MKTTKTWNRVLVLGIGAIVLTISFSSCAGLMSLFSGGKKNVQTDVSFDSNTLQNVQKVTDDKLRKDWLAISPDSTKMLYCESEETKLNVGLWADDYKVVFIRNIATAAKTPLISDNSFAPAWFDDDRTIVYVTFEGGVSKIMKTSVAGGGKTYVTRNPIGKGDANPTVRGNMVLLDTFSQGKRQIASVRTDGTEVTMLGEGRSPSWHPNGEKFLFIRANKEKTDVYEMEISTNQVTALYSDPKFNCGSPSYSKDGKYILFVRGSSETLMANVDEKVLNDKGWVLNRKTTKTKVAVDRLHLFLMRADGANLTQITSGNNNEWSPKVTKNNEVYYISDAGGHTEIWKAKLNLEGLELETISDPDE